MQIRKKEPSKSYHIHTIMLSFLFRLPLLFRLPFLFRLSLLLRLSFLFRAHVAPVLDTSAACSL